MRAGLADVRSSRDPGLSKGVSCPCTHAIHCQALMCRVVRRACRQISIEFFSESARPQILQPVMDAAQVQQ
jgi:hypothetical protein